MNVTLRLNFYASMHSAQLFSIGVPDTNLSNLDVYGKNIYIRSRF